MSLTDAKRLLRLGAQHDGRRGPVIAVVVLLVAGIALLDALADPEAPVAHLYYLPILLAGVKLGQRPAIAVALASVCLFHFLDPQRASFHYEEADIMQLVLFVVVALVSSRLAAQSRELLLLATTDDLTGLHNLRSFEANARREIAVSAGRGEDIAMIALDVDRLKSLNDVHGHLAGADAVRQVGRMIAEHVPKRAIPCRYGGDEFVIFVPRCDAAEAMRVAQQLCKTVHDAAPTLAGVSFSRGTLSVSIGVTVDKANALADPGELAEGMFRDADRAMYDAKAAGRGRVVLGSARVLPGR